jgi:hypothetical protein
MKNSHVGQGSSDELVLACGRGANSSICVLKKGISINHVNQIKDLPSLSRNGIFSVNNRVFLKFYGVK